MRIAILTRSFNRASGGAESYAVSLAAELAARHEVHVFAQESNRPVAGITYHRVFCLGKKPRWVNQLVYAIASWWATRRGFDVVHAHENTWHGQIQTVHVRPLRYNALHGRQGWRRAWMWLQVLLSPRLLTYVWLEGARFAPRPGRAVVATSEPLRQECAWAYPAARPLLHVITPGVQLPREGLVRAVARRRLDLPADVPLLLFVANDYRRKGLDALLQALALLPADVHLAVAGNPAPAVTYKPMAARLGLAARVHFLGALDDLEPAYRAADVLAHPTLEDSYGMVVLEAMAHGLPVVVSGPAHCGIARELHDGADALLLHDPHDARALARLLRAVLDDPALAEQLRQQGLRLARARSWEQAAARYEALYRAACGHTGQPG
ncbi:MAG: glycosyltransferase family 4 protein [Hylemonella sp.]